MNVDNQQDRNCDSYENRRESGYGTMPSLHNLKQGIERIIKSPVIIEISQCR